MKKNERKCLISKLNKINEKIKINDNFIIDLKNKSKIDIDLIERCEIDAILLNNQKINIENSLINDCIEEL